MTIERSFNLSLSAISPPSKPRIIEKGPVISRFEYAARRYSACSLSSALMPSIVDQKGAAMTFAASSKLSPCFLSRKSIM